VHVRSCPRPLAWPGHDPNAATKISTVDGHEQLEDARASDGSVARVVGDSSGDAPSKVLAKSEQQRGSQQQPREHAQKSIRRRLDEKQRAQQAADDAGRDQRNHHALGDVEVLAVSAAACGDADPQG